MSPKPVVDGGAQPAEGETTASGDALADLLASSLCLRAPSRPPRLLLVLDVNGLLVDRRRGGPLPGAPADLVVGRGPGRTWVYARPHSAPFLNWALGAFDLAVWSSASLHNLTPMVKLVFGNRAPRLRFVWDQSRCDTAGSVPTGRPDGSTKPRFEKRLCRVFKAGLGHADSTLLVDDDPYKAAGNAPHTALHPAAYSAEAAGRDCELAPGGGLRVWLERLAANGCWRVGDYVAAHPLAPR